MEHLPMQAFRLNGTDEYIELTIDEAFGFPNETSYGGGYGVRGSLSIEVGSYAVHARHYFTTGELYVFYKKLEACYKALSGTVDLFNLERELELTVTFEKYGHVKVTGEFQERLDIETKLIFEMMTDQTQISSTLKSLSRVASVFGGNFGIRNKKLRNWRALLKMARKKVIYRHGV